MENKWESQELVPVCAGVEGDEDGVELVDGSVIDIDKIRAGVKFLVKKFITRMGKVARGLGKLYLESIRSRRNEAILTRVYAQGLVNGRVYYLAHHGKQRTRKKQYGRARRVYYRGKR